MSSKVHFLSLKEGTPARGYWDQAFLEDLLMSVPTLDASDRHIFIIPGAYQGDIIPIINDHLAKFPKVLVFVTSDEEGKFDVEQLDHPDMYVFSQYGTSENMFPLGYTPTIRETLRGATFPKTIEWSFCGQINHSRRRQMGEMLTRMTNGAYFPTEGFAQGLEMKMYGEIMSRSAAVICPAGNQTQDSFRFYEALEAGAVPIVDRFSAQGNDNYWDRLFPGAPFLQYSSVQEIPELVARAQDKNLQNVVFAWWQGQKAKWRENIQHMCEVGDTMAVVVPTSPIPSHPSIEIIEETIKSIKYHVGSEIFITIDGVREEQEETSNDYTEYISRLLWKCNFEWKRVVPILHQTHKHQSGMIKSVLEEIHTPLLLYVEHDTPLVTDEPIDWEMIVKTVLSGDAHAVRFHFEAHIPEEHEYLMVHDRDIPFFTATKQWSQRPHVASTAFYREIVRFFSPDANCFIEDLIYGKSVEGNWDDWKLFIYTPPGNIKRSLNLDGRAGDRKFEAEQKW